MAVILDKILNARLFNNKLCIFIQISRKFAHESPIENISTLLQMMASLN